MQVFPGREFNLTGLARSSDVPQLANQLVLQDLGKWDNPRVRNRMNQPVLDMPFLAKELSTVGVHSSRNSSLGPPNYGCPSLD